jgi:hypothetical protein
VSVGSGAGEVVSVLAGIVLHAFGPPYNLPVSLALYLYAAGGVVVVSFALVVLLAGNHVGAKAIRYPRRLVPVLIPLARSRWPRLIGGVIGVVALLVIVVTGMFGSSDPNRNPSEYLTWILFWAATVIASGVVGNLWYLFNPWAATYDALNARFKPRPIWTLPSVGIWPAVVAFFAFACLELTTGMANRPWLVAAAAISYTVVTLAGMILFGRESWLSHCEAFTVLFDIIARFGPVEADRDEGGRVTAVYLRPWGVGLLKPDGGAWDRVTFVILMLSTLAFDALIATPSWQDFTIQLEPVWLPMGPFGYFFVRTLGLVLITVSFFLVFVAFMDLVIYFGTRRVDHATTLSSFALTLVPIALAYDAAHNYYYVMAQSQRLIPLLSDPLAKGWHLWPAVANVTPNLALAQPATVWYAQVVLIVLGAVIAICLAYLRAGERFRVPERALLSQYPMLLLLVGYTMTSLWILAQPVTRQVS